MVKNTDMGLYYVEDEVRGDYLKAHTPQGRLAGMDPITYFFRQQPWFQLGPTRYCHTYGFVGIPAFKVST